VTVVLTGSDLNVEEVVRVARRGEAAALDRSALERMASTRALVEQALERNDEVYGLTTGVGADKSRRVEVADAQASAQELHLAHLVGQGDPYPDEVVRGAILVIANSLATGWAGVRPELAVRVLDTLADAETPRVRSLGSVGEADLAALADLARHISRNFDLAPGEGLALLSGNAFSTGHAALALSNVARLLEATDAAAAVSLEGFGANLGMLHPAVAASRPFAGVRTSLERIGGYLVGSRLRQPGAARSLQDPLVFRTIPQVNGTARDALAFASRQLAVELNSSQGNPIVVAEENLLVSGGNFDSLPLTSALDTVRIGLAPAIASSSERVVKLLDRSWSGLPRGLVEGDGNAGLSYHGIAVQAIAAEARLLAAPVSFELISTAHAEGIEDRMALTPLAARRTAEMADLGVRVVAIELAVAAQAVDTRNAPPIGGGVERIRDLVRERVPLMESGDAVPPDPETLLALIRDGRLSLP
jgi:histidine ammonia-lyase